MNQPGKRWVLRSLMGLGLLGFGILNNDNDNNSRSENSSLAMILNNPRIENCNGERIKRGENIEVMIGCYDPDGIKRANFYINDELGESIKLDSESFIQVYGIDTTGMQNGKNVLEYETWDSGGNRAVSKKEIYIE